MIFRLSIQPLSIRDTATSSRKRYGGVTSGYTMSQNPLPPLQLKKTLEQLGGSVLSLKRLVSLRPCREPVMVLRLTLILVRVEISRLRLCMVSSEDFSTLGAT